MGHSLPARGRVKGLSLEKVTSMALVCVLVAVVCAFSVGYWTRTSSASSVAQTVDSALYSDDSTDDSDSSSAAANSYSKSVSGSSSVAASTTNASSGVVAGASQASSEASTYGVTEGASTTVISVVSKKPKHGVSYEWTNAPMWGEVYLVNEVGSLVYVSLPASQSVREDETYTVDAVYQAGTTVYAVDDSGVYLGKFTFSGWDLAGEQTMGTEAVTIKGSWTYTKGATPVPQTDSTYHTVSYAWTGAPAADTALYTAAGQTVQLSLPAQKTVLSSGLFTVDSTYRANQKLYTHDAQGNVSGYYIFSGWSLSGEQIMGKSDIIVAGSWTYTAAEKTDPTPALDTHSVTYSWSGAPEAGTKLYTATGETVSIQLPSAATFKEGATYAVDATYTAKEALYVQNDQGQICGSYTFSGWTYNGQLVFGDQIMGTSDVVYTGTWVYSTVEAPHTVSYSWDGFPDKTVVLYDEAGNVAAPQLPTALTLERGQTFEVDTTYFDGMTLYAHNEEGLVTRTYTFSGWNLSGQQTMGAGDVLVSGSWTSAVPTYSIAYEWSWMDESGQEIAAPDQTTKLYDENGKEVQLTLPEQLKKASQTLVDVDTTYTSETVVYVHDDQGVVTGRYEFSGWDITGELLVEEDATISGQWTFYAEN